MEQPTNSRYPFTIHRLICPTRQQISYSTSTAEETRNRRRPSLQTGRGRPVHDAETSQATSFSRRMQLEVNPSSDSNALQKPNARNAQSNLSVAPTQYTPKSRTEHGAEQHRKSGRYRVTDVNTRWRRQLKRDAVPISSEKQVNDFA